MMLLLDEINTFSGGVSKNSINISSSFDNLDYALMGTALSQSLCRRRAPSAPHVRELSAPGICGDFAEDDFIHSLAGRIYVSGE